MHSNCFNTHLYPSFALDIIVDIHRPLSDPTWDSLDDEDAVLLEYGYSRIFALQHWVNSLLFRAMSAKFGHGISTTPLRYSILSYLARDIPISNKCDGMDGRYRRLAIDALGKKLWDRSIQEAELFAAYFLVLRTEWHSSVSIRHYEGCIGMYKFIA